jgi:AraC-like DNA-binding protein
MATITCERRTYTDKPQGHSHSYAQLVLPINGILTVTVDADVFNNDCPNVIFIPPASYHSFHSQANNQFLVLDIPPMYLSQSASISPECQVLDEQWKAIRTLLAQEVKDKPVSNSRLVDLSRYIVRLLERNIGTASIKYMHDHFHQDIRIQQLAELEHYHLSYYCEWFQKNFGVSPMAYIRNLRFEAARQLLESSDHSILQIAQQVGYQHQSTLTRLFQEYAGVNPVEYRKNNRIRVKNNQ